MALFRKKADPISDRARALSAEIAALESEIRKLDSHVQQNQQNQQNQQSQQSHENPRLRSTALPHGGTPHRMPEPATQPIPAAHEPIFEDVDQNRLKTRGEAASTPEYFNDLGVRKYDLPALLRRIRNHFRGPSTTNPKLVNYLAAGGIQGLRPMRYEKRVARNRFVALFLFLFVILLGFILALVKHH
jgi:hypothetical protein